MAIWGPKPPFHSTVDIIQTFEKFAGPDESSVMIAQNRGFSPCGVEAKFTTDKVQQRCHWVLFHWLCTSYLRMDTNVSSTACTKFPSAETDQRCHSVFITLQLRAITVSQCRHLHSWALLQSRQLPTLIILKAAGPQTARWSNQCGQLLLLLLLLHSDAINRDQHKHHHHHHHQKIKPSGQQQAFGPEALGSGANQAFAIHHHQHQLRHHHTADTGGLIQHTPTSTRWPKSTRWPTILRHRGPISAPYATTSKWPATPNCYLYKVTQ